MNKHLSAANGKYKIIYFLLLFCFAISCMNEEIPGGEITIRNDIMDKEYNNILIERIITKDGGVAFTKTLSPGNEQVLPAKNIQSFRVSRRYKDYTNIYEVSCPKGFKKKVKMKLIDIHMNRISGGCFLSRKGKSEYGSIKWEDK